MTCRLVSTGVTLTGTATVSYAWGFKWGFPSLLAKMTAYLEALDNLRQQEPAWIPGLCRRCQERGCACGSIEREFVKTIEAHTGGWGGTWTISYVGKLIQTCVPTQSQVSSSTRNVLKSPNQEPVVANVQIPEKLGDQNLWMIKIDESAYSQRQCCTNTACKNDALFESVALNADGKAEYVLLFSCADHIHYYAEQFGFDVPIV
jgi:hypothetical protein